MAKNMQMPQSFIMDVYRLLIRLEDYELDEDIKRLCNTIEGQIKAKIEAMEKREVFTKYKTGVPGSDEREQHRKDYLELVGIHKSFKSENEISAENL